MALSDDPTFQYPGMQSYDQSIGGNAGNWSPVWPVDKISKALADDQDREAQIQDLVGKLTFYPFYTVVDIPFTNVPGQTVLGKFPGIANPVLITSAQTTSPEVLVEMKSQTLNQVLTTNPVLMPAIASQAQNANPYQYWQNPLLVPPTGVLQFKFTDRTLSGAGQGPGKLTLQGHALIQSNDAILNQMTQRLFALLNNYPLWIHVDIQFTGSPADGQKTNSFDGIANPVIIIGATTNLLDGTVQMQVQTLSNQSCMQTPVPLNSFAGISTGPSPVLYFPTPLVIPPMSNLVFKFFQSVTNPQPAGDLGLLARVIGNGYWS